MSIMETSPSTKTFLAAKRTRLALLVLLLGLMAVPAARIAGGIYFRSGQPISWRYAVNCFEWLAAALGLVCCIVAPLILKIPVWYRILFSMAAVAIYAIDIGVSTVASMLVFGPQF